MAHNEQPIPTKTEHHRQMFTLGLAPLSARLVNGILV